METFSALLALCVGNSPVTCEFPSQRPVTRSVDVFFDLRLNKRMSKQSWDWWFETSSCPLWRHCNVHHILLRLCSRRMSFVLTKTSIMVGCCTPVIAHKTSLVILSYTQVQMSVAFFRVIGCRRLPAAIRYLTALQANLRHNASCMESTYRHTQCKQSAECRDRILGVVAIANRTPHHESLPSLNAARFRVWLIWHCFELNVADGRITLL